MVCKKRGLKVFLALVLAFSIFCAPAQMQLHVDAASSDQLSDLQQKQKDLQPVSYTHLDVYKRQHSYNCLGGAVCECVREGKGNRRFQAQVGFSPVPFCMK